MRVVQEAGNLAGSRLAKRGGRDEESIKASEEERKMLMEKYAAQTAVTAGAKKNETEGPEVLRLGR